MSTFGKGIILSWNGNAVAELTSVSGYTPTGESHDASTHDMEGYFRKKRPGLIDPGVITLTGFFDYTNTDGQIAMAADFAARTSRAFVVTWPNSIATLSGTGFLTSWQIGEATLDGEIPFTAEITIDSAPTFAVSTSAGLTTPFFAVSDDGVIAPDPSGSVYEYVVNFAAATASFTITPTASAGTITITANGVSQTVASGVASSAIALGAAGSTTEVIIKVEETNKAPKIYRILAVRAAI